MGPTHRQLAEMAATTRVSETKSLIPSRQLGTLIQERDQLFPHGFPSCLWRTPDLCEPAPWSTSLIWKAARAPGACV